MITEDKFYDKAQKFALLKNTDGKYFTLDEYREQVAPTQTDKNDSVTYLYTTDPGKQDTFIRSAKKKIIRCADPGRSAW